MCPEALSEAADLSRNRSKIVFGVDDNPANLAFLKETLTAAGYTFMGFRSGAECISATWRVTPRLILLDVLMPELDGFETCRRLRKLSHVQEVPIAFATGLKTREDVRVGLQAGGNDFFIKPFDRDRLLERVQMWTNRRVSTGAQRVPASGQA